MATGVVETPPNIGIYTCMIDKINVIFFIMYFVLIGLGLKV